MTTASDVFIGDAEWRDWVTKEAIRRHGYCPTFIISYVPESTMWRAVAEKWSCTAYDPHHAVIGILRMIAVAS
jgi:hypothetical protein